MTWNCVANVGNGLQRVGCTFWHEACGRESFLFLSFLAWAQSGDRSAVWLILFIQTICFGWLSHCHHAYQWNEYKFSLSGTFFFFFSRKQHSCLLLLETFSVFYPVSMKAIFPRRPSYNYLQETGFPVNICISEWSVQFASTWISPNFIIGLFVNCTLFFPLLPQTRKNCAPLPKEKSIYIMGYKRNKQRENRTENMQISVRLYRT